MSDTTPLRLVPPPADDRPTPAPALEPLLLSARDLAALLQMSLRSIRTLDRAGRLPSPLRLTRGCVRWKLSEIHDWIAGGCPPRQAWEARRDARKTSH
jgi:predicted DNA-binding transcriptional regulator AlpA